MVEERTSRIKILDERDATGGIETLVSKIADVAIAIGAKNAYDLRRELIFYEDDAERISNRYGIDTSPYNNVVYGLLAGAFDNDVNNVDVNNDFNKTLATILEEAETAVTEEGDYFTAIRKVALLTMKHGNLYGNDDPRIQALKDKFREVLDPY